MIDVKQQVKNSKIVVGHYDKNKTIVIRDKITTPDKKNIFLFFSK